MQDSIMQAQTRPFVKLAQGNMDLLTRFSTSPEVTSRAMSNAGQMFLQASEMAIELMRTGAFARMVQGMLGNYVVYLTEVSQGGLALASQGQAEMMRQMRQCSRRA